MGLCFPKGLHNLHTMKNLQSHQAGFLLKFAFFAVFAYLFTTNAAEPKATPLFDGTNLAAWHLDQENGWEIEDGLLRPNAIRRGNYIWTRNDYSDFVLKLEFKMSEKCNSGVFFRTDPTNPVQGGFEIQIFDSAAKSEIGSHDCGALYDAMVPKENAAKPAGEWNAMTIRVQGPKVTVVLNGKKVVEANLDEWTTANQTPDGSKNKFKTALKDLPRTGKIGFQYHGHPVWFRNVTVRELGK